jgi:iron complex transport system substrate-binding protein
MKIKQIKGLTVFALLFILMVAGTVLHAKEKKRIVSLAPAITEIVFALGQGDRIVGNTKFCNYPEAAKKIPRIGGLMDVNLEVLISREPDIIFLYPEHYKGLKVMEQKARLVQVNHTNLEDLFEAIHTIASALELEERGRLLTAEMRKQLETTRRKATAKKPPKVLLIIGRNRDNLTNMYIIGKKDFLNELIEIAGGVNAYSGSINYPSVSVESIVAMNPDVIIELSSYNEGITEEEVFDMWKKYAFISAVKKRKIRIVKDSVWLIPGPRVVQIAKKMQQALFD